MEVLGGGAVSHERGTPVDLDYGEERRRSCVALEPRSSEYGTCKKQSRPDSGLGAVRGANHARV